MQQLAAAFTHGAHPPLAIVPAVVSPDGDRTAENLGSPFEANATEVMSGLALRRIPLEFHGTPFYA